MSSKFKRGQLPSIRILRNGKKRPIPRKRLYELLLSSPKYIQVAVHLLKVSKIRVLLIGNRHIRFSYAGISLKHFSKIPGYVSCHLFLLPIH